MTCNDLTCRVCNVDRTRLCPNELANPRRKLNPVILKTGETRQTKITTDPLTWFSKDELKRWRKSRKSKGWLKSGCNRQKRS